MVVVQMTMTIADVINIAIGALTIVLTLLIAGILQKNAQEFAARDRQMLGHLRTLVSRQSFNEYL